MGFANGKRTWDAEGGFGGQKRPRRKSRLKSRSGGAKVPENEGCCLFPMVVDGIRGGIGDAARFLDARPIDGVE